MIVVAIIGLLAAIAVPNMIRARKRTQATQTLAEVKLIEGAKTQYSFENRQDGSFIPKVSDLRPYLQPGSRLYNNSQLSNFRDIFGRPIVMGDLNTPPVIDDATRDYFDDVIPDTRAFWGVYCN